MNKDAQFASAAEAHRDAVYRQLFRMCGNHDDAEDVFAETLLKAYRAKDQLDDPDAFQAWLVQIGRRTCGRLKRREAMRPVLSLADHDLASTFEPTPEEQLLEGELRGCLYRSMDQLPAERREVYQAVDIEGHSVEAFAKAHGLTMANAKSRLHRARRQIRELIEAELNS